MSTTKSADLQHKMNEDEKKGSLRYEQFHTPSNTPGKMKPNQVYPGAEAIEGPNPSQATNDEFTVTSPPSRVAFTPHGNPSMPPVSARVVDDREGDFEFLQEKLERQEEQLERVLAGIENAPVATVMTNDEEAQLSSKKHKNKEEDSSNEGDSTHQEVNKSTEFHASGHLCGLQKKWVFAIAAAVLVVVIVIVVLGVSLSKKESPSADSSSDTPVVCTVLADGSNLCCHEDDNGYPICIQENLPYAGYRTFFYNCPSVTTDVNQCGNCEVLPPGWDDLDDTYCTSCSVCSETMAFDCSNLGAGSCDCLGNCIF